MRQDPEPELPDAPARLGISLCRLSSSSQAPCYTAVMATANAQPAAVHPVIAALRRAPVGAPYPPEVRVELDRAFEEIQAGRARLVRQEDIPAVLEEMYRAEHGE